MNISEIRKQIYEYHEKYYSYTSRWPWYSYRKYKLIFYNELASIIIFTLLNTSITPNMVTLCYIGMSILAGILTAFPVKMAVLAGIFIIFVNPVFDWVDGPLARIKKMTSISGDIMDSYAALLGWVILWSTLGIYLGNFTNRAFYYLAPIMPAIFAIDIYVNARERFIYHYFTKEEFRLKKNGSIKGVNISASEKHGLKRIKSYVDKLFEHNSRTADIICLLIFIELFSSIRILWIFYSAFLIWQMLTFLIRLYVVLFTKWAEDELDNLRRAIYG